MTRILLLLIFLIGFIQSQAQIHIKDVNGISISSLSWPPPDSTYHDSHLLLN